MLNTFYMYRYLSFKTVGGVTCIFSQLVGAGICGIGLWAWTEKDMFSNIGKITTVTLDPALIFIISGGVMFVIGFCGCIGALRENTCLLMFVSQHAYLLRLKEKGVNAFIDLVSLLLLIAFSPSQG